MDYSTEINIANVRAWTGGMPIEWDAVNQIRNISELPILAGHIALMPDVHLGKGATVGSVIPTRSAIIPAAVGVDIGCGMLAVETSLTQEDLPDSLAALRSDIEAAIPVGFNSHNHAVRTYNDGLNGIVLHNRAKSLNERFDRLSIMDDVGKLREPARVWNQCGTLGGGNHFIEVCLDETGRVWLMLHSGSRYIGKTIGETAISMAKEHAIKQGYRLVDRDLAWLDEGTAAFDSYVEGMHWSQDYAALSRDTMLHLLWKVMKKHFGERAKAVSEVINVHHNYSSVETHFGEKMWITRKGAVSAQNGQLGIIPGSMGAKSFIVVGNGCEDAYCSCSHGAGRKLSRGAAKRTFSLADLAAQTIGIECRKDESVLDEIPGSYKDIDEVMAAQRELVSVKRTLKQVLCVKG